MGFEARTEIPESSQNRLVVVGTANLINIVMATLFAARLSGLPQVQYVLGIVAMTMGFALGCMAFIDRRSKGDKWTVYLPPHTEIQANIVGGVFLFLGQSRIR